MGLTGCAVEDAGGGAHVGQIGGRGVPGGGTVGGRGGGRGPSRRGVRSGGVGTEPGPRRGYAPHPPGTLSAAEVV